VLRTQEYLGPFYCAIKCQALVTISSRAGEETVRYGIPALLLILVLLVSSCQPSTQPSLPKVESPPAPVQTPAAGTSSPESPVATVTPIQSFEVQFEVDSSDYHGVRFVAPESGIYEVSVAGGAYCYVPPGSPAWPTFGGWRTGLVLYVNRPVEWGQPDRWGVHPISPDHGIGSSQPCSSQAEAEAAGQGLSVKVNLEKGDYLIALVSDGSEYYFDNCGVVRICVTGPLGEETPVPRYLLSISSSRGDVLDFAANWWWSKERNQDGRYGETSVELDIAQCDIERAWLSGRSQYSQQQGSAKCNVYISTQRQVTPKDSEHVHKACWMGDIASLGKQVGSFSSTYGWVTFDFDITEFVRNNKEANQFYVAFENLAQADVSVADVHINVVCKLKEKAPVSPPKYTFGQGLAELYEISERNGIPFLQHQEEPTGEEANARYCSQVETIAQEIDAFQERLASYQQTDEVKALQLLSGFWKHHLLALCTFVQAKQKLGEWSADREKRPVFEEARSLVNQAYEYSSQAADLLTGFVDQFPEIASKMGINTAVATAIRDAIGQARANVDKAGAAFGW